MKLFRIGVVSIVVGVCLLVASFAWRALPNDVVWSKTQAQAYASAAATFHNHTFDKSITKEQMQKTREEYETRRKQYDRALSIKNSPPTYLRIAGLIFAVIGVVAILTVRNQG